MKKKILITLFSLITIAVGIVLAIVFLFSPIDQKEDLDKPLSNNINDISMSVGDVINSYHSIEDEYAEFSFKVDKPNIIYIDKTIIKGLNAGKVNVEMSVTISEETTKTNFIVKVYQKEFSFEFIPISECSFDDNKIYITNSTFQFYINIYDTLHQKVENVECDIRSNIEGVIIQKNFLSILVITEKECVITFNFSSLSTTFSKIIIINF